MWSNFRCYHSYPTVLWCIWVSKPAVSITAVFHIPPLRLPVPSSRSRFFSAMKIHTNTPSSVNCSSASGAVLNTAGCVSAGEHVRMTSWSLNTKSPKTALTFCNMVTMEIWLLLHPGRSGREQEESVPLGGGGGGCWRTVHNEPHCSKNLEGGDEL